MTLRGRRPGDRRVRVELVKPQAYEVRAPRRIRRPPQPAVVLIAGFAVLIAIGAVVLMLPVASADGRWTEPLVALFTATSAVEPACATASSSRRRRARLTSAA